MTDEATARESLRTEIPNLRAFAFLLCADSTLADDLVEETVIYAWANINAVQMCMSLWLLGILRKNFYAQPRYVPERARWKGAHSALLAALAELNPQEREAIALIDGCGVSYVAAARVCGCSIYEMRKRVSRGRGQLALFYSAIQACRRPPHREVA